MTQLFQDVRKDLSVKPNWMDDAVFKEMKENWDSPQFKLKSEQNKKNRDANAGASVHTDGCIPHRIIWKRLKEATGKDPSFSEFYFRTRQKEKEKSWVNEKAKTAYEHEEYEDCVPMHFFHPPCCKVTTIRQFNTKIP
nr:uncharacterized protein LOC104107874 [Nicotiana tomentosiformis]